jgi:hypothetical protein
LARRSPLSELSVLALCAAVACGRAGRLDPDPPRHQPDSIIPPAAPLSTISVPLEIPVGVLSDLLERAVPRTFGTVDSMLPVPREGRASVAVALERGPFRVRIDGQQARIETTIGYALRVNYAMPALPDLGGSCGTGSSARPRLRVAIGSPVSIDRDWSLRTRASVGAVGPASAGARDRCQVTLLGVDVTDDVVGAARAYIERHLAAIDSSAARVDTRGSFEGWWGELSEPIQLEDSLWLAIGPEGIRRGALRGTGDTVEAALALTARPRIVYGPRPKDRLAPLPALDTGTVVPRLDLLVDARADYAAISDFLDERLAGTMVEVGNRSVQIRSLGVQGIGGGRLALALELSGNVRGRLYLTGTPTIDPATGRISIPDLEFDEATREELFPFLPELSARPLRDFLRSRAVWPAEPAVKWLTQWLASGLNRLLSDDLGVTGIVDDVGIVAAYAQREALFVRISARGRANLFLIE